ncbi:DUF2190 family protein [Methylobrevis pamukkalensis]|uniref:DUF2190 domain-containing protein n=1 Tax=Methylobrevis pamukkalensis TaxID=1439726 RepID=A0A1E3H6Q5_9HYPH|nr:DUF2190 family protein [Methylobrevis pamukkalensis]ODN71181.1 hypothetical protein A6302_01470 [Methylobrevis pamukkalensis]
MDRLLIKTATAGGSIAHRRFVKFSADGTIVQASAATDLIVGVSDCPNGAVTGERADYILLGIAEIDIGGTVARGAFVTSDANGKAVAAAPASGANAVTAGQMRVSAVGGDIAEIFVHTGMMQGA